ncbi:DUF2749 domain-containing protein (plasmid) [Bradyrhizobium barranii]|uniref:DUF2749 domain-containing protein n=1 Tax=Bradyrhizobium barranii TaxID=2992140 RepID=A0ABY3R1Q7_9BRAD|nr:DUF2749 domain-containing protein [Bradyrhizobium japonicum]UFW92207.1 DUF2749 domain-containing protein [Bradyrhizobium japonicum]
MRPSTIILVLIAIGISAAGASLLLAPRMPIPAHGTGSGGDDFVKPPQDYKTSGGQQMKPRW